MQKVLHGPGIIPTFELGFNSPSSDLTSLDTWRGIPGAVGFPNRWTFIDETAPDDTDYISQGVGNGGSIYEADCGPVPVVAASTIIVSYRVRRTGGTGLWSSDLSISRGGVLVHDENFAPGVIPLTFTTFAIALTPGEIATLFGAVGNIQLTVQNSGGPGTDSMDCSWMRVAYFS